MENINVDRCFHLGKCVISLQTNPIIYPHNFYCLTSNQQTYNNLITLFFKLIVVPYCPHSAWFDDPLMLTMLTIVALAPEGIKFLSYKINQPSDVFYNSFTQIAAC